MQPTTDSLSRAQARIERAKQHFTEFEEARQRFNKANRDFIVCKEDTNTGRRVYRPTREPIIHIIYPIIAGDVLQNLRSALDQKTNAAAIVSRHGIRQCLPRIVGQMRMALRGLQAGEIHMQDFVS